MCKDSARGLDGNAWKLGTAKSVTMEQLWDWVKVDGRDTDWDHISGEEYCTYFEK